jgi:hypothetical protein
MGIKTALIGPITASPEGHVECPESEPANDDMQFSRSRVISAPDENAVVVERLFRFSFPRGAKVRDPGISKAALRGQRFKMKTGLRLLKISTRPYHLPRD